MERPTLVIMAAGMGSRFGGSKQVTPVDDRGHVILDYSAYDAMRAGFGKVVCVIKPEMEAGFRAAIGDRIARKIPVAYAFQTLDRLPEGFSVPEGRAKPWGTGHAVLCAAECVSGGFAAINADDFYGRGAFEAAAKFLMQEHPAGEHAMVAYRVENTLTEHGSVSRGVCHEDGGYLTEVVERTTIVPRPGGAAYIEGDQETFLPAGTPVSMNMWAFQRSMMDELKARFARWLVEALPKNPAKAEYFLPMVPNQLIHEGTGRVRVLRTDERWFGVTYREDLDAVKAAIAAKRQNGEYPEELWG